MFRIDSKFIYNDGVTKWVNAGILSLDSSVGSGNITTPSGYEWSTVSMLGKSGNLCTALASAPQTGSEYSPDSQYVVAPSASFEYPTAPGKKNYQAKTEGSADYCYWDSGMSKILISFADGGSKSFDPNILTVTKNGKTIIPTVKLDNGSFQAVSGTFTISTEGDHTLTYQYVDPYNYRYSSGGEVEAYNMTYIKTVDITVVIAQENIQPATFDFNGKGYRTVVVNNTTYVMPDVNATATNSIGSKTVGNQTIYYPIIMPYYSTSTTGTLTRISTANEPYKMGNMYIWCPIFDGVVTITDYDENNNPITYGSSNIDMAEGKLVNANPSGLESALKWSSASNPDVAPVTKNNKLYYRSTNASSNARSQTTPVFEYQYTDNAGNSFRFFVGYYFPAKEKGGGGCVTAGTMITLADGTEKPIEEITAQDKVLAWDFNEGKTVERCVSGIAYHGDNDYEVTVLHFSGGTVLKLIEEHGVFDYDLNCYVYPTKENYQQYLGHQFPIIGKTGVTDLVTLDDVQFTVEHTGSYAISSDDAINVIAEGLVTVVPPVKMFNCIAMDPGCKMQYDRERFEQDVMMYGLYSYDLFEDYMTEEQFDSFHYAYFRIAVGKGILTWDDVLDMVMLHQPYMLGTICRD